jgi:hypothetical protein
MDVLIMIRPSLGTGDEYLNYAMHNRAEWESKGCEIVEEMVEAAESSIAETAQGL